MEHNTEFITPNDFRCLLGMKLTDAEQAFSGWKRYTYSAAAHSLTLINQGVGEVTLSGDAKHPTEVRTVSGNVCGIDFSMRKSGVPSELYPLLASIRQLLANHGLKLLYNTETCDGVLVPERYEVVNNDDLREYDEDALGPAISNTAEHFPGITLHDVLEYFDPAHYSLVPHWSKRAEIIAEHDRLTR